MEEDLLTERKKLISDHTFMLSLKTLLLHECSCGRELKCCSSYQFDFFNSQIFILKCVSCVQKQIEAKGEAKGLYKN
jgi:hypothetical protein